MEIEFNDYIIPLAWPNSYAKTASGPYDFVFKKLKLLKNNYYKTGHAALLLINSNTGDIKYFDFGRYISMPLHGRIRDEIHDPETTISTKAKIDQEGNLINLNEIIQDIGNNPETHGYGEMFASLQKNVNFKKVYSHIKSLQKRGCIPYGPFHYNGTNCSRFVAEALTYSGKSKSIQFKTPIYLTPSPLGNIFNTNTQIFIKYNSEKLTVAVKPRFTEHIKLIWKYIRFNKNETPPNPNDTAIGTILPPKVNKNNNHQWLGGTGSGAWYFLLKYEKDEFFFGRIQKNGSQDFLASFQLETEGFDPTVEYHFSYPSHGEQIILIQENKSFLFTRL